jgi:7-carboxy-7-deazaguanine synthase
MTGSTLLVSEMFGPTIQGEGPSTGQRAMFVRLSRCNLACQRCDTPYTWDWQRFDPRSEAVRLPVDDICAQVLAVPVPLVIVTGGEPMIQRQGLDEMVERLAENGRRVEIETNGTIVPSPRLGNFVHSFNVSPKLSAFGAGMPERRRIREEALDAFVATGRSIFKFVVSSPDDLEEVSALERRFGLVPIWVMPEGTMERELMRGFREIADEAIARGWNVTLRMHALLWGDERGR